MSELVHVFAEWILEYGAPILFLMLVVGIVGLPIPDETLLVISGVLIAKGKLDAVPIIIAAITGSICGITISYVLGRWMGPWVERKFTSWFKISPEKIQKVENWYQRIGKWILLIGYFIPLVRHLAGFVAGGSKLNFKDFMIFAYVGALIWCSTFLSIGYFLLTEIVPKLKM